MSSREEAASRENIEAQDLEENMKQMVTVTDPGEVEMGTTGGDSGVVSDFLMSKKEVKWCWALLGLRIAAFVFCLIAFSVLAADKKKVLVEMPVQVPYTYDYSTVQTPYSLYWYHYAEFKFCFSANVIGFVYSVFQIGDLVRYLITKNTQNPKLKVYFTIAMDQVLAYVLMSASTSAATASHLFRSIWAVFGGSEFTEMANASVVLSFLAFVAFALASLVSSFILCRFSK